jgi:hypothetical protein
MTKLWEKEKGDNQDFVQYSRFRPIYGVITIWLIYSLFELTQVSNRSGFIKTFYENTFLSGLSGNPLKFSVSLPTQLFLVIPSVVIVLIGSLAIAGTLIGVGRLAFMLDDRYKIFTPFTWCQDKFEDLVSRFFDKIDDLYNRYIAKKRSDNENS